MTEFLYTKTGKIITIASFESDCGTSRISYTSDGIQKLNGEKPTINVGQTSKTKHELAAEIKGCNNIKRRLPASLVLTFISKCCEDIKETLSETWSSFGLTIGAKDTVITPLSILKVVEKEQDWESCESALEDSEEYKYWLYYCVFTMKLLDEKNENRKRYLMRTMDNTLRSMKKPREWGMSASTDGFICPTNDKNLLCLLSAIDMFLVRFPESAYSGLRAGTDCYRQKGFGALQAMRHTCNFFGFSDLNELKQWASTERMIEEITRILKDGEELEEPYSYSNYLIGMNLSGKSPYSAGSNNGIYFFCNSLCALYGCQKGAQARMMLEFDWPGTRSEVFFAFLGNVNNQKRKKSVTSFVDTVEAEDYKKDFPASSSEWFQWLQQNKVSKKHAEMMRRACEKIICAREGTIGEHWKRNPIFL